uniref:hypothetical protein n=1 Tax=Microtetraspora malaysiensis TaxID=161358 RepID=UPI003F49835E
MGDRARSVRGTGGLPARRPERLRPDHTYRLANGTTVHLNDPSLARPLIWIGEGLAEVGIMPGRLLTTERQSAARALMDGVDLRTGEQFVAPRLAVDPRAKLPAAPLLAALTAAA